MWRRIEERLVQAGFGPAGKSWLGGNNGGEQRTAGRVRRGERSRGWITKRGAKSRRVSGRCWAYHGGHCQKVLAARG